MIENRNISTCESVPLSHFNLRQFIYVSILLISLLTSKLVICQEAIPVRKDIKQLRVGDRIPSLKFKAINHSSKEIDIASYKGKLLILDFWSTYCTVCIQQFPKMERLQAKYNDKLMILPVTSYKDESHNLNFFKKRKDLGRPINLPSLVEADELSKMFPSFGLPHEVWIDGSGTVIAITDHSSVVDSVIDRYLKGQSVSLPVKQFAPVNAFKPILVDNNGAPDSLFMYRSIITGYISGLSLLETNLKDEKQVMIAAGNRTPVKLLEWAEKMAGNGHGLDQKQVIIDQASPYYTIPVSKDDAWKFDQYKQRNWFNYELNLPPSFSLKDAYLMAVADIKRFFKIDYRRERRDTSCLLLIRNNKRDNVVSATINDNSISSTIPDIYILNNTKMKGLVDLLNFKNTKLPLILDETGFSGEFDVKLKLEKRNDVGFLNDILSQYNLRLVEGKRNVEVIVFK